MNTNLLHNPKVNKALEDARKLGFEDIFIIQRGKLMNTSNKNIFDPKDIAIVDSKKVALDEGGNALLCYVVADDGELGLFLGKAESAQLAAILGKMLAG